MTELEEEKLRNQSLRAALNECQDEALTLADLRDRVEALPILLVDQRFDPDSEPLYVRAVPLGDVLDLIDGNDL